MTQQNQEYTLHSQILLNPEARSYPCLCLCFGFSQMILIAPLRLMTLHFSQIGLTDALTFTIFSPFQNVRQLLYHLSILKASTNLPKNDRIPAILQSNRTKPFNLFISPDNSAFAQIIRRHFNCYFISWKNSNKVHSQFSTDMSQNYVFVFQLSLIHI